MPFDKPSAGGAIFDVEDGRYLVKVAALEDTEAGEFGPGIKWVLNVATTDRQMLKDERGFNAELWQFSSAKMTPRAKGRKWAEAFLNRELDEDTDDGSALMKELVGKWAVALLAHNEKERIAIVTLSPLKAAKEPVREPVGAGAKAPGAPSKRTAASTPDEPPDDQLDLSSVPDADEGDDIPFA